MRYTKDFVINLRYFLYDKITVLIAAFRLDFFIECSETDLHKVFKSFADPDLYLEF